MKSAIRLFKTTIKNALVYSRLYKPLSRWRTCTATSLRILSFHKVTPRRDPFFPGLTVDQFKSQLLYLKQNYEVVRLGNALARLSNHEAFEKPVAAITFDDGFHCFFNHAYPLLQEFNLPATLFLTTGYIDTQETIWPDRIAGLLKKCFCDRVKVRDRTFMLDSQENRLAAIINIKTLLKELSGKERDIILQDLWDSLQEGYQLEYPFLSWDEILRMDNNLIEYGSHTVSHPILSTLTKEEQCAEIENSKKILEEKLQRPVTMFAYPNGLKGDYNKATLEILQEQGFIYAFLNYGGAYTDCQRPDLEIPRITEVHGERVNFVLRVAGLI